jgi:hypothetical protein
MDDLLKMYNVALAERLADAANPVKLPVQNLHLDWPPDAEYRAEYRLQAWPTGAMNHVSYFASFAELDAWYTAQLKWTQLEDNYFWLDKLEHWDLGPQLVGLEILDRH